jgi:hypothetical protein
MTIVTFACYFVLIVFPNFMATVPASAHAPRWISRVRVLLAPQHGGVATMESYFATERNLTDDVGPVENLSGKKPLDPARRDPSDPHRERSRREPGALQPPAGRPEVSAAWARQTHLSAAARLQYKAVSVAAKKWLHRRHRQRGVESSPEIKKNPAREIS